jgi:hypothetical protein
MRSFLVHCKSDGVCHSELLSKEDSARGHFNRWLDSIGSGGGGWRGQYHDAILEIQAAKSRAAAGECTQAGVPHAPALRHLECIETRKARANGDEGCGTMAELRAPNHFLRDGLVIMDRPARHTVIADARALRQAQCS